MSKKKDPYRPKPLTDSKREFISNFITEFNLKDNVKYLSQIQEIDMIHATR